MTYCERCGILIGGDSEKTREIENAFCLNCIDRDGKPKQLNLVRTDIISFWNNRKQKDHRRYPIQ